MDTELRRKEQGDALKVWRGRKDFLLFLIPVFVMEEIGHALRVESSGARFCQLSAGNYYLLTAQDMHHLSEVKRIRSSQHMGDSLVLHLVCGMQSVWMDSDNKTCRR